MLNVAWSGKSSLFAKVKWTWSRFFSSSPKASPPSYLMPLPGDALQPAMPACGAGLSPCARMRDDEAAKASRPRIDVLMRGVNSSRSGCQEGLPAARGPRVRERSPPIEPPKKAASVDNSPQASQSPFRTETTLTSDIPRRELTEIPPTPLSYAGSSTSSDVDARDARSVIDQTHTELLP